jgi:hypothetical protein
MLLNRQIPSPHYIFLRKFCYICLIGDMDDDDSELLMIAYEFA